MHQAASEIRIRKAHQGDAQAIALIYNEGIRDRAATLETEERTADERREWLTNRSDNHPVFVVERGGAIVAWGSLNPFNSRPAYRFVADFSVYVARTARGTGCGSLLLVHLIAAARELGFHKLVLAAFPWNEAGIRLYRKHGFRDVGIYHEQGLLDGRWVDTIIMELLLNNDPPPG